MRSLTALVVYSDMLRNYGRVISFVSHVEDDVYCAAGCTYDQRQCYETEQHGSLKRIDVAPFIIMMMMLFFLLVLFLFCQLCVKLIFLRVAFAVFVCILE